MRTNACSIARLTQIRSGRGFQERRLGCPSFGKFADWSTNKRDGSVDDGEGEKEGIIQSEVVEDEDLEGVQLGRTPRMDEGGSSESPAGHS